MRNRTIRIAIAAVALSGLLFAAFLHFGASAGTANVRANNPTSLTPMQKRLLSGFVYSELNASSSTSTRARVSNYFPDPGDDQCALSRGSNIKVNQNCLNLTDVALQGRGQANNETAIAVNPNNSNDIVSSNNDYRRGDGTCGTDYTLDGANHWNDSTVPNGFTLAQPNFSTAPGVSRQYWEASGDTSVAWDTKGNVYLDCQMFNRGAPPVGPTTNPDASSGIYVFRSTHNNGASWNFTGRPVVEQLNNPATSIVPLLDKPYMTVDNHVGSPFQDRIYVTWTLFAANGTANIYESYSNDYGEHFSAPVLVSPASTLCPVGFLAPNQCDENQDSDPFTGPDGALYVVYSNFNNAEPTSGDNNQYQLLVSKSVDGGATFSPPVRVAPFNDLPECSTYQNGQDAGRACVPEKGSQTNSVFRAGNYASGQVNPTNPKQVVITFGSYINKYSNPSNGCVPTGFSVFGNPEYTGVKTAGACNNKILESISNDAGATFTGSTATDPTTLPVITSAPGQRTTDQWWQWSAFSKSGELAVSYYDRQYNNDEFNGNMDFSLSGSTSVSVTSFDVVRVTSSSMPLPTEFPDAQGNSLFFGDYTGLDVNGNTAYPIWMDTRDRNLTLCPGTGAPGVPPQVCRYTFGTNCIQANDENIYMAKVAIP